MARDYLTGNRDQPFLLPPDMREWLPSDHLVWFVIDLVGRLDLGGFAPAGKDPRGRRRYDPAVIVTVLIYAYCVGERSSRRIERRCHEDVAFRVAATNLAPDHTTISRFLKDHAEAFEALFVEVLSGAVALGMGRVGSVFLDSTKVAADASPLAARTRDNIVEEVRRITEEARRVDAEEDEHLGDRCGDELPPELVDPGSRRARLEAALAEIDRQEAEDEDRPPSARRSKPAKANVTDPECRVMKGPRGYFPAYNAQAVASEDGLVVAADVIGNQADNHLFDPMVDQAGDNLEAAGAPAPERAVADNGYYTNANADPASDDPDSVDPASDDPDTDTAEACDTDTPDADEGRPARRRPEPFIRPPTDKRRKPISTKGPIPRGATPAQVMERKLATEKGAALYKQRGATIEPVFGMTKSARGITRFRRRGLKAARAEWRLATLTHNILKMWRHTIAVAY